MFVHMSFHYPKSEYENDLIESMHRFGAAMKDFPGFISAQAFKDESTGRMVGLAIWNSKKQWEVARPAMAEAVKDDPFDFWEERPPEVFHLHEK